MGVLESNRVRGNEIFNFSYNGGWLTSRHAQQIDPHLHLYRGVQYNDDSDRNFEAFLDSCPDRWGRLLMQRREAALAKQENRPRQTLQESDYLLGVHDHFRMGALRFKRDPAGPFLDNSERLTAPPVANLRELEYAVNQIESNPGLDDPKYLKWLYMLIAPGSSLGGARPKACVTDGTDLWLAKFPSQYDDYDIAAWEFLTYQLATNAGIEMAPCRIDQFNSHHHTFLTKRFDRIGQQRLHFSSAMTQLGYYDGDQGASYLDIAQFLIKHGANTPADLAQLWRRIVFSIAISNTDDHLRNHGFILSSDEAKPTVSGWLLAKAYDLNPNPTGTGLHLNIDDADNRLDFQLARDVAPYFQLNASQAEHILQHVLQAVAQWKTLAEQLKIPRAEQQMMESAFRYK